MWINGGCCPTAHGPLPDTLKSSLSGACIQGTKKGEQPLAGHSPLDPIQLPCIPVPLLGYFNPSGCCPMARLRATSAEIPASTRATRYPCWYSINEVPVYRWPFGRVYTMMVFVTPTVGRFRIPRNLASILPLISSGFRPLASPERLTSWAMTLMDVPSRTPRIQASPYSARNFVRSITCGIWAFPMTTRSLPFGPCCLDTSSVIQVMPRSSQLIVVIILSSCPVVVPLAGCPRRWCSFPPGMGCMAFRLSISGGHQGRVHLQHGTWAEICQIRVSWTHIHSVKSVIVSPSGRGGAPHSGIDPAKVGSQLIALK